MKAATTVSPAETIKKSAWSGVTYRRLFWLFLLGSVAGLILEGLWCVLRKGAWESHTSLVWGPFCTVYGFGAVAVYLSSILLKDKKLPLQFLFFAAAGAVVEYFSSLLQELFFGSTSWDYSGHFLNIGGRVSLKMTLVWGVIGIAFMYLVFPLLERLLRKMEGRLCRIGCFALSVFMAVNCIFSAAAVMRWSERLTTNTPPTNVLEQFLDETYDNEAMEKNYPNMRFTEQELSAH